VTLFCSSGPPDKDETDIGNRDPALKSSYKGLQSSSKCVRCSNGKLLFPLYSSDMLHFSSSSFFQGCLHAFLVQQSCCYPSYSGMLRKSWSQQKVNIHSLHSVSICCCFSIGPKQTQHSFRLLYEALTFSGLANFRNLSCTDPAKVSTAVGSQTYFHAVGGGGPLLFCLLLGLASAVFLNPEQVQMVRHRRFWKAL